MSVADHAALADSQFQAALRHQTGGRLAEAEAGYCQVLSRDPKHVGAQHNLGMVKLDQGHAGAALAHIHYAIELAPNLAEARNTLGNALRQLGRTADAEASYRKAVDLNAGYAGAWFNLATLLHGQGKNDEAETGYRRAIEANARHRDAHINLSNLLRASRPEEAMRLVQRAVEIDPNSDLAHNNLGNLLRDFDRLNEAAESYRRAVAANPRNAVAMLNLGTVLNHVGGTAESADVLRRAIELDPGKGEPYFQLATTVKLACDDPAVAAMRKLCDDPGTSDRDRMFAAFGLGRVYDGEGLYDEAFRHWLIANRLQRATLRFDIRNEERIVASIRNQYTKPFLDSAPRSEISDDTPIFIVGMIRSGTTLTEQILASHPLVVGGDELPWFPELARSLRSFDTDELTRIGQAYIDQLRERFGSGPRFITDKLVGNWLYIGLIHLALPNARIIRTSRHPYDVCLSAWSSWFVDFHAYCYDMTELATFYRLFHELSGHWDQVLPGKVHHQRYESLIEDPETSVRRLLDFCGLPFDQKCLDFHTSQRRVRTASSQQVREKLHTRSVERWRHYESHLGEWQAILGDIAARA
jgi:tetratricopeptide (TPR) repeat protein